MTQKNQVKLICNVCHSKYFLCESRARVSKFCSKRCKDKSIGLVFKKYWKENPDKRYSNDTKMCKYCGDSIFHPSLTQKYHKDCSIILAKKRQKEWRKTPIGIEKERYYNKKYRKPLTSTQREKHKLVMMRYISNPIIKKKRAEYLKEYDKKPEVILRVRDRKKILSRIRRAKKNQIIEKYTNEEWNHKISQYQGVCPMCKNLFNNEVENRKITLDHIIPISKVSKGFVYTIDDIQPLCKGCNSTKSNKLLLEVI